MIIVSMLLEILEASWFRAVDDHILPPKDCRSLLEPVAGPRVLCRSGQPRFRPGSLVGGIPVSSGFDLQCGPSWFILVV